MPEATDVTKSFRSGGATGAIIILFTVVMIVRERRTGHLHRLLHGQPAFTTCSNIVIINAVGARRQRG